MKKYFAVLLALLAAVSLVVVPVSGAGTYLYEETFEGEFPGGWTADNSGWIIGSASGGKGEVVADPVKAGNKVMLYTGGGIYRFDPKVLATGLEGQTFAIMQDLYIPQNLSGKDNYIQPFMGVTNVDDRRSGAGFIAAKFVGNEIQDADGKKCGTFPTGKWFTIQFVFHPSASSMNYDIRLLDGNSVVVVKTGIAVPDAAVAAFQNDDNIRWRNYFNTTAAEQKVYIDNMRTSLVTQPNAADVKIDGETAVGLELSASYTFVTDTGMEDLSKYQWYRSDSADGEYLPIEGADQLVYTPELADKDKYLKFAVTPENQYGIKNAPVLSPACGPVTVKTAPPVAENVRIIGNAWVGSLLTGDYQYVQEENINEADSAYQWLISDNPDSGFVEIAGATEKTYTVREEDENKYIQFSVTPKSNDNIWGEAKRSGATAKISGFPVLQIGSYTLTRGIGEMAKTITKLENGTVCVSVPVENTSSVKTVASSMAAVLLREGTPVAAGYASAAIAPGQSDTLSAGFVIPDGEGYTLRLVVWDNAEDQNVISINTIDIQ